MDNIIIPRFLYPPKTNWTVEEDRLLTEVVKKKGAKRWNQIAEFIPGRSGKQCRERWMSHIAPGIKNNDWTEEEVEKLIKLQEKFGNKWSKISKYFENRPANVVKNKFNCILRRKNSEERKAQKESDDYVSSPEIPVYTKQETTNKTLPDFFKFNFIELDELFLFEDNAREQWQDEF